ncbi:hypothetical protein B7494_g1338 [Chlorociboria aeruginascens]|nr:hypothetical protein B7494_g1338 [Chlorociboria aeruginascens]
MSSELKIDPMRAKILTSNLQSVRLVAVSKLKPATDILALHAQQEHFGENYAQELMEKAAVLPRSIKWHFIGGLQSNKCKPLASSIPNLFIVSSVDSEKKANQLDKGRAELVSSNPNITTPLNIHIQINTSGESSKSGVPPGPETSALCKYVTEKCPHLHLLGLMTIGAIARSKGVEGGKENEDFICLREEKERLEKELGVELECSMGMSDDFERGIEMGSGEVRVGSSIFGARPKKEDFKAKEKVAEDFTNQDLLPAEKGHIQEVKPRMGLNNGAGSSAGGTNTRDTPVPKPTAPTSSSGLARQASTEENGPGQQPMTATARKWNTEIPHVLPHERVFPIQIGSELFRLSGASISSDGKYTALTYFHFDSVSKVAEKPRAPSYFSQFFKCQLTQAEANGNESHSIRTLYIDRDPVTFKDISLHLQGYHVRPRDASHFVKLFADAHFYSREFLACVFKTSSNKTVPRLVSQLYEESIFISIGHRDFQIPRELFSDPGNSPNYFSLGFAIFFATPTDVFPGLSREGLLRPPSIIPPSVPSRSADTFTEILHLLRGYPLHIRDDEHRAELLRDCRYFHLKGLEQKLIRHHISFNLSRSRHEIIILLSDVRQSGISVVGDPLPIPSPPNETGLVGWVNYARPFVDDKAYELVLEIGDECMKIHLHTMRAEFFGDGKTRISRLFEVIATKLNLPTTQPLGLLMARGGASSAPASPGNTPLSEDQVRIVMDSDACVFLDGKEWKRSSSGSSGGEEEDGPMSTTSSIQGGGTDASPISSTQGHPPAKKRKIGDIYINGGEETWIVKTGQWRLKVRNSGRGKGGVECLLVAVRIDAISGEYGRNIQRGFLGP